MTSNEPPTGLGTSASVMRQAGPGWVAAVRWTARILGTLLAAIYGLFVVGEGLPPIGSQPEGVN